MYRDIYFEWVIFFGEGVRFFAVLFFVCRIGRDVLRFIGDRVRMRADGALGSAFLYR